MSTLHSDMGEGITTTLVLRSLLASVSSTFVLDYQIIFLMKLLIIIVNFKAHWQLFVLCPRENMVIWFCSLLKNLMLT